MGKKNHGKHSKQQTKHSNAHNLKSDQSQLHDLVDKLLRLTTQNPNTNINKELEAAKEILSILERIKDIESAVDNKYSNHSGRCDRSVLERFTTWLKENGATYEGASIAEFPGYDLGLKADINIPKDSLIIAVPRSLMITNETALKSNLNTLITKDKILQNMPNVALAIYVLLEKFSNDSFWKPYFDILPSTYTTVLYFTGDELELLSGSPTLRSALNQIKSISRQYAYFHKMIFTAKDLPCEVLRTRFTYKEYCWAVSTIMTRQNTIPSQDDKDRINALIPLWDMCNHTNGSISTDYNPDLHRCECLAVKDFKADEQLFIFYGPRTNADLFIHNGFVFENNEHDYYPLTLGISQSDPLREKRLNLLGKMNIDPASPFKLRKDAPPMDGDLLAFLRIFNMNDAQLDHWLEGNRCDDLTYGDCALETLLEKKTWTFLQMRIKLLLASYKTTLEEDIKAIGNANTPNANLALRMKTAEKRILHCVLDYVDQCTKQFN